jgi:DNA end-binding protein Ku
VIDLMAALKKSVGSEGTSGSSRKAPAKKTPAKKRPAKKAAPARKRA